MNERWDRYNSREMAPSNKKEGSGLKWQRSKLLLLRSVSLLSVA
jgi:hypothetical protein